MIQRGSRAALPVAVTALLASVALAAEAGAQERGEIEGQVVREATGEPVPGATVVVSPAGRIGVTDRDGSFVVDRLPPGRYHVTAQRGSAASARAVAEVAAGQRVEVVLRLAPEYALEEISVTAARSGVVTAREAFNAISTVTPSELSRDPAPTLGAALEREPGVAKREFGPGAARPVIRGFDGDRVLMMQDGLRVGDLSSTAGDHGTPIDPMAVERVEVLRGPATLMYGTNAVGGVVNVVTLQDRVREDRPDGTSARASVSGATADEQAGASASLQHRRGGWTAWAGGAGRRTGDYDTPYGTVPNSATRLFQGSAGAGRSFDGGYASLGLDVNDHRYGVPFVPEIEGDEELERVELDARRVALRLDGGTTRPVGPLEAGRLSLAFVDWRHDEEEDGAVATTFDNRSLVVRAQADQSRVGPWSGSVGVWAQHRESSATGDEELAPPVTQRSLAGFAVQELDLGRVRLQAGARLEGNAYDPEGLESRSFVGVSASMGANVSLGRENSLFANVTRSHRAPALEELFNEGPHVGTLTYEIGDPDLEREASLGVDAGVRIDEGPFRARANVFRYAIDNFVFMAPTGETRENLPVAEFRQADARFVGFEASLGVRVHPAARLKVGSDLVRARRVRDGTPLPRIPPLRARTAVELRHGGFEARPEAVLVGRQDRTFVDESPTAGHAVFNLGLSYEFGRGRESHQVSLRLTNLTDRAYRNHLSFVKDRAPEQGRSLKLSYLVSLF